MPPQNITFSLKMEIYLKILMQWSSKEMCGRRQHNTSQNSLSHQIQSVLLLTAKTCHNKCKKTDRILFSWSAVYLMLHDRSWKRYHNFYYLLLDKVPKVFYIGDAQDLTNSVLKCDATILAVTVCVNDFCAICLWRYLLILC